MSFDKPNNQTIKDAIEKNLEEDGWALLAKVGATLKSQGINYGKLSFFFKGYADIVEIESDDSVFPPVPYARLKDIKVISTAPVPSVKPEKTLAKTFENRSSTSIGYNSASPKNALRDWAWLSG